MNKLIRLPWFKKEKWHPSDDDLLRFVDGQLSARKASSLRTHLQACWSCRLKAEKIQKTISCFVESLLGTFLPGDPLPPKHWGTFVGGLRRVMAEPMKPANLPSFLDLRNVKAFLPRFSFRLATGLVGVCFLLLVLIRLSSAPPVSAKEILQFTEKAVAERIRQVPEPVIYQQLQVHSYYSGSAPQDFVTWETWTDGKGHRLRQRVKDASGPRFVPLKINQPGFLPHSNSPLTKGSRGLSSRDAEPAPLPLILAELQQTLEANRIDAQRPLSPTAYETWRSSIQTRSEEVIETQLPDGEKALTIKTNVAEPFAPNCIVEAEFMVRVQDWHPVTQRFRVQREKGIQNFELAETAFQVLALNTLPAAIFADLSLPAPPRVIPQESIAPSTHAPSTAELVAAEIEAHYALHRVKACLGEPIEVVRHPSGIKVGGLAKTEARKTELLEALQHVPLVVTEIQTIDEALKASSLLLQSESDAEGKSADAPSVETFTVEIQQSKLALDEQLESYFARSPDLTGTTQAGNSRETASARLVEFSKEVVSLSRTALFEAWALRRLAAGYGQSKVDGLRPSSQWLLETMLQEHIQELTQQVASLRASLGPVLSSIRVAETGSLFTRPETQEPAAPDATQAAWSARCLTLFYQVEQMSDLVHGLFADASLTVSPGATTRQLLSALPQLESGFHLLEGEVAAEFSVQPRLPFSNDKSLQLNSGAKK